MPLDGGRGEALDVQPKFSGPKPLKLPDLGCLVSVQSKPQAVMSDADQAKDVDKHGHEAGVAIGEDDSLATCVRLVLGPLCPIQQGEAREHRSRIEGRNLLRACGSESASALFRTLLAGGEHSFSKRAGGAAATIGFPLGPEQRGQRGKI
jgi:hypothetical protein